MRKALFALGFALCLGVVATGPVFTDEPLVCGSLGNVTSTGFFDQVFRGKLTAANGCFIVGADLRGKVELPGCPGSQVVMLNTTVYGNVKLDPFACLHMANGTTLHGSIQCELPASHLAGDFTATGRIDPDCLPILPFCPKDNGCLD